MITPLPHKIFSFLLSDQAFPHKRQNAWLLHWAWLLNLETLTTSHLSSKNIACGLRPDKAWERRLEGGSEANTRSLPEWGQYTYNAIVALSWSMHNADHIDSSLLATYLHLMPATLSAMRKSELGRAVSKCQYWPHLSGILPERLQAQNIVMNNDHIGLRWRVQRVGRSKPVNKRARSNSWGHCSRHDTPRVRFEISLWVS